MLRKIKEILLLRKLKSLFPKVEFAPPVYLEFEENIKFVGYAYVGPHAYWSGKGKITVGNNCIFGPKTTIWTYNHNYESKIFIPYDSEDILKEVVIEDNVWVGLSALILPGVRIAEGAVIGAGSVVTKDVPKCAIVGGNPAAVIKYRDTLLYEKLKSEGKLYLNNKWKYD